MSRQTGALLFALLLINGESRLSAAPTADIPEIDLKQVISGRRPEYPYEARRRHLTGTGYIVVEVNPATGRVTRAYMDPGTGSTILDNEALFAFRRWRFKPGTPPRMRSPISFMMAAGTGPRDRLVASRSMDDALAAFLGKGTVVNGPIPEYPRDPAWTNKRGKGVYEIRAAKNGRVEAVRVVKPSGDEVFDHVTVETLRKWKLRRGPLIVELPLSFTLTPTNYSVAVAR